MKAVFIQKTGAPEVCEYGDVPDPVHGADDVIVRTAAVSVNPIDVYIRSGAVKAELPCPYIPGCDFAGTVVATGANVSEFETGDRVWGSNQGLSGRQGTFAELCCIDRKWLYATPENVDDVTAAGVALTAITAHLGLFLHGALKTGETVFVNGGTGGVGSAVVQIAADAGATVVTTVGSEEKADLARSLGATHVINYRESNVTEELQELAKQTGAIDLWFETLRSPNPESTIPRLAKRGRYILMAGRDARPEFPVGPFYVNDLRAIGFAMFNASPDEQRAAAEQINLLMSSQKLRPIIGAEFSFQDAVAAHRLQEENTLHGAGTLSGKIVLRP